MFLEYTDPYRAQKKKKKIDNIVFENSSKTGFRNEQFIGKEIRKNGLSEINKAYYKLNKLIANAKIPEELYQNSGIAKQIDLIRFYLSEDWLTKNQIKAVKAILLISETMPYHRAFLKNGEDEDAYLILLLPFLNQILFNLQVSSSHSKFIKLEAFESLKMLFLARLSLGFGRSSKSDITAIELALLARHNNLKSIRNALSDGILHAVPNKKNPLRIKSQSARRWLTETKKGFGIKNRLIELEDIMVNELNERLGLEYLNDFKISYSQILNNDDIENLEYSSHPGVYLWLDIESREIISLGYVTEKLIDRKKTYSQKFHQLIFEPRLINKNRDYVLRCSNLIQCLLNETKLKRSENYISNLNKDRETKIYADDSKKENNVIIAVARKKITIDDSGFIRIKNANKCIVGSVYEIENTYIKCLFIGFFQGHAIATFIKADDVNYMRDYLKENRTPELNINLSKGFLRNDLGDSWRWRSVNIEYIKEPPNLSFTPSFTPSFKRNITRIQKDIENNINSRNHEHMPIVVRQISKEKEDYKYELIAGYANYVAARVSDFSIINCIVLQEHVQEILYDEKKD